MSKHRLIFDSNATALVEAPVADQTGFRSCQQCVHVVLDFELRPGGIPYTHLVDLTVETLVYRVFTAANLQFIHHRIIVGDGAGAIIGVDQHAIGVGINHTVIVRHR